MFKKLFLILTTILTLNSQELNFNYFLGLEEGINKLNEKMTINNNTQNLSSENYYFGINLGTIINNKHRFNLSYDIYDENVDVDLTSYSVEYGYKTPFEMFDLSLFIGIGGHITDYTVDFGYFGELNNIGYHLTGNIGLNYYIPHKMFSCEIGYKRGILHGNTSSTTFNNTKFTTLLDKFDQIFFSANWNIPLTSKINF